MQLIHSQHLFLRVDSITVAIASVSERLIDNFTVFLSCASSAKHANPFFLIRIGSDLQSGYNQNKHSEDRASIVTFENFDIWVEDTETEIFRIGVNQIEIRKVTIRQDLANDI